LKGSVPVNNRAGPEGKRIRKEFILEKFKQLLGSRKFWAPCQDRIWTKGGFDGEV
jgi:hypothetical protein